ncbi:MAG: hypothetical protein B7C54_02135 [Acidimicrobiales bacterium mtb01]|nr:DUF2071 domain-containing protein [Actinomycetota bacterium]TEX47885.1 MAG: hypothetical protein B7C54_02135 [Acidimicrobiales bacterium mtb01]
MTQRWQNLAFLHWAYEPEQVARLLPEGVELDTFEGKAYVALVPFQMRDLQVTRLPKIPGTSDFPEINVRTYVRSRGRPAVWFFSLDTPKLLPTIGARVAFRLPYCFGPSSVTLAGEGDGAVLTSEVSRRWPDRTSTSLALRVGAPLSEVGDFEHFLTDRWGLVAPRYGGGFNYGAVEHGAWPLHTGEVLHLDDSLLTAAGLPAPQGEPHVLFSPGVDVGIQWLQRA